MGRIISSVQWIVTPSSGEITGYRRKINGVDTDFAFSLPGASSALPNTTVVPEPLWIVDESTGVIEGYRRALFGQDISYSAQPGTGTASGALASGVQWLANTVTGEIVGYRTVNANGSVSDRAISLGAALNLTFAGSTSLDSKVTFTRSSDGTYFDSNGVLQTAGNNVARLDHNPVTRAARGLLIEDARTNLLLNSSNFSNASWTYSLSPGEYVQNTTDLRAPDNTFSAFKALGSFLMPGVVILSQNVSVAASTVYTFSVYVSADLSGSVVLTCTDNGGGFASQTVQTSPGVWTRYSLSFTSSATATSATIGLEGQTGSSSPYFWGAQFEAGVFPSSYIYTTGAPATRQKDVATIATLSPWYNSSESTLFAEAELMAINESGNRVLVSMSTSSFNEATYLFRSSNTANIFMSSTSAAVGQFTSSGFAVTTNTMFRAAGAIKSNDGALCVNGGTVQTDSILTMPSPATAFAIGVGSWTSAAPQAFAWIRRVAYYSRRLSNAELQAITA